MSASLVGSEMCIRDRVPRHPQGRAPLLAREAIPMERRLPNPRGGARTVSYTHLTLPTICSV
eukprot:6640192-Alexandrium_andersonii.AAC.1